MGAAGAFFLARGMWLTAWKELSVGKSKIKAMKVDYEELRERIGQLELKDESKEARLKRVERDSDEHYNDMKRLDEKLDTINEEMKKKSL